MATRKKEPERKTATKKDSTEEVQRSVNDERKEYTNMDSEQFVESESLEDQYKRSMEGVYKKAGLTVTLRPGVLPSIENLIVLFDYKSKKHSDSYDKYVLKILASLNLEKEYLLNKKPDFELEGYGFFQISEHRLICLQIVHPKENPSPFYQRILEELRHMSKRVEINQIFDTSLYFVLEENENVSISPLHFFSEISTSDSNPISYTLPYPSSAERRLVKNLSGGWEELAASSDPEPAPVDNSPRDKIDFHLDDPALEDKLGRRPIANSLAKLINDDIFGNKKCHAFMAHLQGRWGEGKSSFMKFLEDGLQETGDNRWIVIHYNAWKNQSVDPPWWTFLDALYTQAKEQIEEKRPFYSKWTFIVNELINRFNKPSLHLIIFVLVLVILLLISIPFEDQIANKFSFLAPILGEAKVSILALLGGGSLITIIQSWSKFLLMDNAENAKLFVSKTENPAEAIRNHFDNLVHSIQKRSGTKKGPLKIAFFIDDLDRCDSKFIVKLLEGIQTMFNKQKVFYLVAADKHWISKSFEHEYSKYSETVKKGTKLGYSFIEKNFQLSIRLPNPSPKQISYYWDYILNSKDQEARRDSEDNISAFRSELSQTTQSEILSGSVGIDDLLDKHQISFETAQSIVLDKVNESTTDIEHLLKEYHNLIGSNPRAVKRLANQYTVFRNIVFIEQNTVNPEKLFRWIVLQNRWPILVDQIELKPDEISKITKPYLEKIDLENHLDNIKFVIGAGKERLTTEDVITFTGIGNLAPID